MSLSMFDLVDEKTMLMQIFQPAYLDRLKESANRLECAKRCYFNSYLGMGCPDGEAYEFTPRAFRMTLTGGHNCYDYELSPRGFVDLVEEIFDEGLDYESIYNERRKLKYASRD